MIREIFIIQSSGLPIYHKSFVSGKMDDVILSGFLGAIEQFSVSVSDQTIESMRMGNTRFVISRSKDTLFAMLADSSDFEAEVSWKLSQMQHSYFTYYEKEKIKFEAELSEIVDKSLNLGMGMMKLGDIRTCILFTSVLDTIYQEIGEVTSEIVASNVFYEAGKVVGRKLVRFVSMSFGANDEDIISLVLSFVNDTMGWGVFQNKYLDFKKRIAIMAVQDSFETDQGDVSEIVIQKKECSFIQGVLEITFQAAFGPPKSIAIEEVYCKLRGDDDCRFIITDQSNLEILKQFPEEKTSFNTILSKHLMKLERKQKE